MNRRLALKLLAASSSFTNFCDSFAASETNVILELDCGELLALIRDGSFRAEEVCATFLQQHERQRSLNVATWIDPSNVLERAHEVDRCRKKGIRLPRLSGLPILVKDNIDTVGFPTSAGTAALKRHFPRANAPVIERLVQQGAIVMGKANMDELGWGGTSSNSTFGFVRNPYDVDLIPGGSSGGSAAAIAARIAPAALGTDSGGSVRIPAAFCGAVGFRPSVYPRPLYSQRGVVPLAPVLDTIGPIGRSVADVRLLHATIVDEPTERTTSLQKLRIGVPRLDYWEDLDPEVDRVARAALSQLRGHGAVLVDIDLRPIKRATVDFISTIAGTVFSNLQDYLRTHVPSVSLSDLTDQIASRYARMWVEKFREAASDSEMSNSESVINQRRADRDSLCAAYRTVFRQHGIEAVVFPTQVMPAPPIRPEGNSIDDMIELNGRMVSMFDAIGRNVGLGSATGAPSMSLPAGLTSDGLPVALEFAGLPGGDSALLALSEAAESAIGRLPAPPRADPTAPSS